MISDFEIGWLAGIIDGEGCIASVWINRKNASGGNVAAEIRVEATSQGMISRVSEILSKLGVISVLEVSPRRKMATKAAYRVSVRRRADMLKLLKIVRPHLAVKGKEADVVISWYEKWGDQRGIAKPRAGKDEKMQFLGTLRTLKKVA